MRKVLGKLLLGVVVLLAVICGVLAILAKPIPEHPFFDHDGVLVMAHRGGRGLRPEHTIYAFERSVELGVDVLELDLRSTKDSVLVIFHDRTVDRTTDGAGPVQDFTLAELRELDAGYRWTHDNGRSFPFRGLGITVPTLSEVFAAFPDVRVNIEIKRSQMPAVESLCRMIRDYGRTERVLVASFSGSTIGEFRHVCPEVATSASFGEVLTLYGLNRIYLGSLYPPPAQALQVPEHGIGLHVVRKRFVDTAHERNMQVHVWLVNEVEDMQRMLALGVDGLITDYPDRLLTLLGR